MISERSENKSRIVGTHFWNPPYLIPLVEVIKSDYTSDDTMDAAFNLLQKAGKRPVRVSSMVRESPSISRIIQGPVMDRMPAQMYKLTPK